MPISKGTTKSQRPHAGRGEVVPLRRKLRLRCVRRAFAATVREIDRNRYLTQGAALAFFFMLSLFPLLIFLFSAFSYVPAENLLGEVTQILGAVLPNDAMQLMRQMLRDVLRSNKELLSFGIVGAIFAASGGFSAMIVALNIAYDVPEGRPYWKRRLVALGLTLLVGVMAFIALTALVAGPHFGSWLITQMGASPVLAGLWPYIRWIGIATFSVLSIEILYFLAPNVKQQFRSQIPGAVFAFAIWLAACYGLNWYLRHLSDMNRSYGVLGAVIALMLWLYISALAILIGAEFNAELLRARGEALPEKEHEVASA